MSFTIWLFKAMVRIVALDCQGAFQSVNSPFGDTQFELNSYFGIGFNHCQCKYTVD